MDQGYLKTILHYCPDTGVFTWLKTGKGIRRGRKVGYVDPEGYLQIAHAGASYRAHRLAWLYMTGAWPTDQIDHSNGDRADNRFSNLRESTLTENMRNRLLVERDLPVGVYKSGPKYRVRIWGGEANLDFGSYADLELAEIVSREVRDSYHGQFSVCRRLSL